MRTILLKLNRTRFCGFTRYEQTRSHFVLRFSSVMQSKSSSIYIIHTAFRFVCKRIAPFFPSTSEPSYYWTHSKFPHNARSIHMKIWTVCDRDGWKHVCCYMWRWIMYKQTDFPKLSLESNGTQFTCVVVQTTRCFQNITTHIAPGLWFHREKCHEESDDLNRHRFELSHSIWLMTIMNWRS